MSDVYSDFMQQIAPLQSRDPKLYGALSLLVNRMRAIDQDLYPLVAQTQISKEAQAAALAAPSSFSYSFTETNLKLVWGAVEDATQYEVRKGADWDTATFQFRSTSLEATLDPITQGSHTYLIKSINSNGVYSSTVTPLSVAVPGVSSVVISASVIDNTVLLTWTPAISTFRIKHYRVERNGDLVGYIGGTFTVIAETVAATNEYCVVGIDIAGNEGSESCIEATVSQPPDFALQAEFISDLSGDRTNARLIPGPKLEVCYKAKSWSDHYTVPGWANIAEKMAAGYPLWFNKSETTAVYEEDIDFGVVLNNVIVHTLFNLQQIHPTESVSVVVKLATSLDGVTYGSFTVGANQFFSTFQYLRVRIEFSAGSDKAMARFDNLTIRLDVKRENDGGRLTADAGDSGGTTVTFNKPFKDVESLTATAEDTSGIPYVVIIDFVDAPNPTDFKVLVFDTTGNRVTKTVSWKARGIL